MAAPRRKNREIWGLIALFAVFIAFATYSERLSQEATSPNTPSMYNAKGAGVKALHLLLERQGFPVSDLRGPYDALRAEHGLLIITEPFVASRKIKEEEIRALRDWVLRGGSVLYLVTEPARPRDAKDALFGDIEVISVETNESPLTPARPDSPLLEGVETISVNSKLRLKPAPGADYTALFQDGSGAVMLHRRVGKGQVVVAAATSLASNAGLRAADNAVLLVNLAANLPTANRPTVLFDEYHHGVGLARSEGIEGTEGGLLENLPVPLRLGLLHLLGLGLLLVYNGNRRFGKAQSIEPPDFRPGTDYVGALARLYQRARGGDIALLTLHHDFMRALTRHLDLPPDVSPARVVERVWQRDMAAATELTALLARADQIRAGARIGGAELLALTRQMESLRRRLNLVGNP